MKMGGFFGCLTNWQHEIVNAERYELKIVVNTNFLTESNEIKPTLIQC